MAILIGGIIIINRFLDYTESSESFGRINPEGFLGLCGMISPCFLQPSGHRAAHDVKKFVGDGLLPPFVIYDSEVLYQIVGVVRGNLHGHASCRMF